MECQYRRSMYCPVCVGYGHSPRDCPNKMAWAVRRGRCPQANIELVVEDTDQGVKAVLKENGVQPGSTHLENRKRLRDVANSMIPPRMIVFRSASLKANA